MTSCKYGVVFFGLGLAQRGLGHLTVEVLLRLVRRVERAHAIHGPQGYASPAM